MKKLNKKGFTLIELLAVIVVLAVIMVIATQQVNKTIQRSRGNAFLETAQSVRKSMQTVCAMDNEITEDTLNEQVDNKEGITITVEEGNPGKVKVKAKEGGKFTNRIDDQAKKDLGNTYTLDGDTYTFDAECPVNE